MTHRHHCPCNWRECSSYSFDPGDPWDGVFRIVSANNKKNDELRRVVEHHLKIPQNVRTLRQEYWVRRHHWNRILISEHLEATPPKKLSTPIPAELAANCNLHDNIDRCRINTSKFMASPNNPELAVREWVQLKNCQKNARWISRENRLVSISNDNFIHTTNEQIFKRWQPSVVLPPFVNLSSQQYGNADASPLVHTCIGLDSSHIDYFCSKSFKNKGICLQYWSYTVLDGKFRSSTCKTTVPRLGLQCISCVEAKKQITAERHPVLFMKVGYAAVTPAHNLIDTIQQLNSNDTDFFSPPIMTSIKTLCLVHRHSEPVFLADRTWLVFCPNVLNNTECGLYFFSKRKIDGQLCSSCTKEKGIYVNVKKGGHLITATK